MKTDNALTQAYLLNYPAEAARILEQVSADHVAALLGVLPVKSAAAVMACMLPDKSMACLQVIGALPAAKLISELPISYTVRVYRLMSAQVRDEISAHLSERSKKQIQRNLKYPANSAGALLNPIVDMLPAEVTVAGALRAIERFKQSAGCDLYIINEAQQLVGQIDIGNLLKSNHRLRLKDIMNHKTRRISAFAKTDTLLTHPGWETRRSLPVVDRDNTIVGTLEYSRLREHLGVVDEAESEDTVDSLMSFVGLYWLTAAQLIDSVFSIAGPTKGER